MMKNLLGGYTFIDFRHIDAKTSHLIPGLYGEVTRKIAASDKPIMAHNFVYDGEAINDTMITNVEDGESGALVLTVGTSYKITVSTTSYFVAEAYSAGSSGTSDYADLENKPRINYNTLVGNKSSVDLNLVGLRTVEVPAGASVSIVGKEVTVYLTEEQHDTIFSAFSSAYNHKEDVLITGLPFPVSEYSTILAPDIKISFSDVDTLLISGDNTIKTNADVVVDNAKYHVDITIATSMVVTWSDPVELGVYSTDETVVGTWTDGKTLYRKVITTTGSTDAGSYVVAQLGTNADVKNLYGRLYKTGGTDINAVYPLPYIEIDLTNTVYHFIRIEATRSLGYVKLVYNYALSTNYKFEIIAEYTK